MLRGLLILVGFAWTGYAEAQEAAVKIPAELHVRVGRLARIGAVSASPVRWINLHDDLDLIPDSSGKFATLLGVKAGRYKIAAYTGSKDGPSEPAYCTVIVEAGSAAPPAPKPNVEQARAATVKIRFGNAGCTATIIGPRRADGKWELLTAAHCVRSGNKGTFTPADGTAIGVTVVTRNTNADVAWLVTDDADHDELPYVTIASSDAEAGAAIWHCGFGIDKPGNKEIGKVLDGPDANGQLRMELSVSPGDSGSGIFRSDNGQLVAVVCCTSATGRVANVWGGCASAAMKLRPRGVALRLVD